MKIEDRRAKNRDAMKRFYGTEKGKAWAARNTERRRGGIGARYSKERRERWYKITHALKSGPCADCGRTFDPICMDFDHRPGVVKSFSLSAGYKVSAERQIAELAKCDVVCACCHRLRTHRQRNHALTTKR